MEYVAAKSTMCRQCGGSFAPSTPKVPIVRLRGKDEPAPVAEDASIRHKFDSLWGSGRHRSTVVECFECKRKHDVSGQAASTNCPGCSAHIDLRDYKITTSFSRSIRTRGDLHVTPKGDLSSTSVICNDALIEGRFRGNLECSGSATVNFSGKIPGRLTAKFVTIERKSVVQCFRRVRVGSIDIKGHVTAEIIADGLVNIHKHASLDGAVTAKAITVEKGGMFTGQLVIGQAELRQAELIPAQKTAGADPKDVDLPSARFDRFWKESFDRLDAYVQDLAQPQQEE